MVEYISKINTKIALNQLKIASFIDCSGSTAASSATFCTSHSYTNVGSMSNHLSSIGNNGNIFSDKNRTRTVLDIEREIVSKIDSSNIVYWSTEVQFGPNIVSSGGTVPSCIFENEKSKEIFQNSDAIIFITDGEISKRDIQSFAKNIEQYNNKVLCICVIVAALEGENDLNDLSVSAISPFMVAPNVISIYHDILSGADYIIASKGEISNAYPNPTNYEISTLQKIDINQVKNLAVKIQTIPNNYILLSETVDDYKVIDKRNIFIGDNIINLPEQELDIIIQYATINNELNNLKDVLSHVQTSSQAQARANTNIQNKYADLIIKIEQIHATRDKFGLKNFSTSNFSSLKFASSWITEQNIIKKQKDDLRNKNLRLARSLVHSSSGSPKIYCEIHKGLGPAVLWLSKFDDINDSHNKYPLDNYPKLNSTMVHNPICGNCGQAWLQNGDKSVDGQEIAGYVSPDYSSGDNLIINTNILYGCLVNDSTKFNANINLLLLSMVSECCERTFTFKNFLLEQLLITTMVNNILTEEGKVERLLDALPNIIVTTKNIYDQPTRAMFKLLTLTGKYHIKADANNSELIANIITSYVYSFVRSFGTNNIQGNIFKDSVFCCESKNAISVLNLDHELRLDDPINIKLKHEINDVLLSMIGVSS